MAGSKGLSFYKRKKKLNPAIFREIFSWLFAVMVSVLIALVLNYFFGMRTETVGVSMEPELYNGQTIYIDRFTYLFSSPKAGDVVVFLPNGNEKSHYYTKRIVAGPGDRVRVEGGILFVNGLASSWPGERIADGGIASEELTLESGEYFCIGDNPNNSEDSRSPNVGPVKEEDMVGKAWFRLKCAQGRMGFIR